MTNIEHPNCLIHQSACGRISGEPVCAKCGIDERIRYVSEEARLLAIANATAKYWEAHAKSLEKEKTLPQPPKRPAPSTPEPPKPFNFPVKNKSSLGWLAVVLFVLGSGYGVWQYTANKQAALAAQDVGAQAVVTRERAERALQGLDRLIQQNLVPAAPAPTPSTNNCTYCPEMVTVPSGSVQMGSNDSESFDNEKPVHSVSIKSFAIGKYEVTQGQWRAVMGSNPSHFANCGDNCPVEQVSWDDIQIYIQKLIQKTGQHYRLPTEAEWEYACRGGQHHKYCGSNDVGNVAWYDANSASTTHPVGQKAPNEFGLYDMSGNVWEWVQDRYNKSYQGAPDDGSAWEAGAVERVLRGGSWGRDGFDPRTVARQYYSPANGYKVYGLRLARAAL